MKQRILQTPSQILTISGELQQSLEILSMQTEELINKVIADYSSNPFLDLNYEKIEKISNNAGDIAQELENFIKQASLKEHLIKQIYIVFSGLEREIALVITDYLDNNGYLTTSIELVAEIHQYNINHVKAVLKILQKLEPTGVYATNLEECLLIQAIDKAIYSPQLTILINNLALVATNKIKELSDMCNCSAKEVVELIALIKTLNPKPGLLYNNHTTQYIVPEVIISKQNQQLMVLPNENIMKIISLSNLYQDLKKHHITSPALVEQKRAAVVIVKAIEQRVSMAVKIMEYITKEQYEFFFHGISYLKSLTLAKVADALNINESTVSRICSKYIEFNSKYYPIKFFFSARIQSNLFENDYANKAIKQKIKELIKQEDPVKPLSDDKITNILINQGIKIARRTVAKYRESLGIMAYNLRKFIP